MTKKLYKDSDNGVIFGVCAGLAMYFDIDVTLVRLITVASVVFGGGGLFAYLIAAIIIPQKPTS